MEVVLRRVRFHTIMSIVDVVPPVHQRLIIVHPFRTIAERDLRAFDTRGPIRETFPRLVRSDEMDSSYGRSKAFVGGCITVQVLLSSANVEQQPITENSRVGCGRGRVVHETQAMPIRASPLVQDALISAVPAPFGLL